MELEQVPGRVFLDTNSVNFIMEHGESIFDGVNPEEGLTDRILNDIEAFYNIFLTGQRASWQLAISPLTYEEIIATKNIEKRIYLEYWFMEVWNYWLTILEENEDLPPSDEVEYRRNKLLTSVALNVLPDLADRMLICDAILYNCDCFCTRDWKSILKHRNYLSLLPIQIITPSEWWGIIRPYARIWA